MRFECNCETELDFEAMVNEVHEEKAGVNFEVGARLWQTSPKTGKTIMVEYQVVTKECKELVENDDEPDWFTAYAVDDEKSYDCSDEIFTETIEANINLDNLKAAMIAFADKVFGVMEEGNASKLKATVTVSLPMMEGETEEAAAARLYDLLFDGLCRDTECDFWIESTSSEG